LNEKSHDHPSKLAFTVRDAASLLSVSRSHVYELIQAGKIDSIKIGRARRITAKQLETYLEERECDVS
jgi:excisionase family DNA binding protein